KSPQGNELKAPFSELIVAGRRLMAARADRGRALARPHGDFDALVVRTEPGAMIDKSPKAMAAVCSENRLAARLGRLVLFFARRSSTPWGHAVHVDPLRPSGDAQATEAAKMMAHDALSAFLVQRPCRCLIPRLLCLQHLVHLQQESVCHCDHRLLLA